MNNLRDLAREFDKPGKVSKEFEDRFHAAIFNDLDMPGALATVWDMMNDKNLASATKAASLLEFDQVLGLDLDKYVAKPLKVPAKVKNLVEEREQARTDKDFKESDRLRDEIEKAGFAVEDTGEGSKLREKH